MKNIFRVAALMIAGTIGAGIFGLPYIFVVSGWLLAGLYLISFALLLAWVHSLYSKTLIVTSGEHRLLGLVEKFYGRGMRVAASVAILGGLLLVLVLYLVLAGDFFALLLPNFSGIAIILFWLSASFTALFAGRRLAFAETIGVSVVIALILYVFLSGIGSYAGHLAAVNRVGLFFPFAATLFALAGWPAIEALTETGRRSGLSGGKIMLGIALGALGTAFLYILFVFGIVGSAPSIAPDIIRGLAGWPFWRVAPVIVLGLLGLWNIYGIIVSEIRRSCEADLRWPKFLSVSVPLLLPFIFFLFGLRNFLSIIGLAGGFFLAIQYAFIVSVSKKALQLTSWKRTVLDLLSLAFILAAVYEFCLFIVG